MKIIQQLGNFHVEIGKSCWHWVCGLFGVQQTGIFIEQGFFIEQGVFESGAQIVRAMKARVLLTLVKTLCPGQQLSGRLTL